MAVQFSIDRPFGIYLYDYFDKAYTTLIGKSATEFTFVQGYTPLSTLLEGNVLLLLSHIEYEWKEIN
jgi:hypothetical protein